MSTVVALALNAMCYLGMQLVWFEGDQLPGVQLAFFGLLVANVLLTASFAFAGGFTGALRATGVFFLLLNLEESVCALPPTSTSPLWNNSRKQTAYAGGVLVLIAVLSSFVASLTNGFSAPAAGVGSRIASLRGLCFLLATIFLLIASAVQWSWTQQCQADTRPSLWAYPVTNGVLVIVGFVFLTAVLYGENDVQNLSVFLAAAYLLLLGYADPIFDTNDVKWEGQKNFENKWKAAKGLSFIGAVLLLLSVWVTGKRGTRNVAALPLDLVAFAIAFAGAVCVFVRDASGMQNRRQYHAHYAAAYAIVITILNVLQGLVGLDGGQLISTFFAAVALWDFDNGNLSTVTGYQRGGLQLCQAGVLLSVFLKAFPAGQPLSSYFSVENSKAVGFGLVWGLLAMLRLPRNYSICILLAIITYRALASGCPNWSRTAFYILSFFGVAGSFPLRSTQFFQAVNVNDYVNSLAWVASAYFVVLFGSAGSPTAPALDAAVCGDAAAPAAEDKPAANEPAQEGGAASA
jgi:uncharacterized membrane protein YidH (DUF202 family)